MSGPDFLCIGAQKSGTTWLDANLRRHPQLWLPPAKELHYFDRSQTPYLAMLFDSDPIKRHIARGRLKWTLREIIRHMPQPRACITTIGWYLRFLFLPRSDDWYCALFAPGMDQVAGEVCPGYSIIPVEKVAHVRSLLPRAKIIYLLRNPIDRAWSQAAMHFNKYSSGGLENADPVRVRKFLLDSPSLRHSRYTVTLDIWEKAFAPDQIFAGFFEQIADNPRQLLLDLFHFLGADADEGYVSPNAKQKVFAGRPYPPMGRALRRDVTAQFYDEIVALYDRFDNQFTESWLMTAERTLQQA